MRYLAVFISLCLLFDQVSTAGYSFPIKTKIIGKFRQWLSIWLSQAQYVNLFDTLEPQLNENTKVEDLQPMLISAAMSITTFGQKLTIAGVGTKFLSKGALTVPIEYFATALGNNIAPFAAQLQEMWGDYVDAGETRQRIFQRAYKMIDMFMTQKRVATIYCRIQKYFNSKDPSWWPFLKTNLGSIVMFTTLDGLGGTC